MSYLLCLLLGWAVGVPTGWALLSEWLGNRTAMHVAIPVATAKEFKRRDRINRRATDRELRRMRRFA